MDRILREVNFRGLLVADKADHRAMGRMLAAKDAGKLIRIEGFDLGRDNRYRASAIRSGATFLRRHLASEIGAVSLGGEVRPRILFIERGTADPFYATERAESKGAGAGRRAIANHMELKGLVDSHFHCTGLQLEGATLAEQIALFQDADMVIAQHGAALSNLVWMRPGTTIIEIISDELLKRKSCFGKLAEVVGAKQALLPQAGSHGPVDPQALLDAVARNLASPADTVEPARNGMPDAP
jgi:hypothetical protein